MKMNQSVAVNMASDDHDVAQTDRRVYSRDTVGRSSACLGTQHTRSARGSCIKGQVERGPFEPMTCDYSYRDTPMQHGLS